MAGSNKAVTWEVNGVEEGNSAVGTITPVAGSSDQATYTAPLLPSFWQFLNHFWIGAETTNAERSLLYFGGQGVWTDLLRLLAWTAVIVALLLLPASRKLERERKVGTKVAGGHAQQLAGGS